MNHPGNGLWRAAVVLLLVVASLMMFTFPDREPLVERFSDESCDVPVAQDVPFLSRQQSGDPNPANAKKWSEPPPWLTWDRRAISELQVLIACTVDICRPPS